MKLNFSFFINKIQIIIKFDYVQGQLNALHITVGGMKSCRLRAVPYQGTRKLERATTLE